MDGIDIPLIIPFDDGLSADTLGLAILHWPRSADLVELPMVSDVVER